MTRERIEAILDVLEIEYRYHHFEECEAVNPPFICWLMQETRNFSADGKVYLNQTKLILNCIQMKRILNWKNV